MSDQRTTDSPEEARAARDEKIEIAKEKLEEQAADATKPITRPKDPAAPIQRERTWWHRHLEPEERQRILAELGIKRQTHWAFRFFTMLGLSIVVAVMGLSANSAAVVIGAMLLAPLMQPVLASAACISMALFKKSLQSIGTVLVATVGGIVLSYLLAALFVTGELPNEVTSRTAPDIRDLVVALGAGTAGAYATVRKDVSSSLPGVAVAVALVPPLGAVGMSLEAGRETLAIGALLLYTTNLAAIVFAASIVFVTTGFVPPKRLRNTFRRSALVAGVVAIVVAAIAVPLYRASLAAVENTDRQLQAQQIVEQWLAPIEASEIEVEFTDDNRIRVRVRSLEEAINDGPLTERMQAAFGRSVSLEWDQARGFTPPSTTLAPSDAELLKADVDRIVDQWLQAGEFDGVRRVDSLVVGGGVVRVDASGVGESPSLSDLISTLDAELDETLEVQLSWVERRNVSAGEPEPTSDEVLASRITDLTNAWAVANGVQVIDVTYDGVTATVDVAGDDQPDATDLVRDIESELPETATVTVLFTERLDITTTTSTTTTTTTTTTTVAPTATTP
ncbi:MAG: TIGR00341 family protein [Ilumatobacter sp.]|uniref:TIGR00341 family protein n=1 Tax=Ilumatobacter sp. TaxID=1967498 RepID=UPI003C753C54